MSIFAKRLSTLKAGTGIRLTSSSGRTITGIIEENDGVESLSVKITSHVCLKYSQIIEFEENEETSFTNYSAAPSVSSQPVYQYGVPQQYVMPSPVAYQYAVPPMQMVNQNPVPQSPVSGQFPVPPMTVAYQNTVPQSPMEGQYANPQSPVVSQYAVPQPPMAAASQSPDVSQSAVPQSPAADQNAVLQPQCETPSPEAENTAQVTPPVTEEAVSGSSDAVQDEKCEGSEAKNEASVDSAAEIPAEPEEKKQPDNTIHSGTMIKYDFHEGEGIIADADGETICFLSDDITEASTKRKIKKMSLNNFKEMDLMYKVKMMRGKKYAYDIRKPYDTSADNSEKEKTKSEVKVKVLPKENRLDQIYNLINCKKHREAIDSAMLLLCSEDAEEAMRIIIETYRHLAKSDPEDQKRLRKYTDRFSERNFMSDKTYQCLSDAYYSLEDYPKCIELLDRMLECADPSDVSAAVNAHYRKAVCYRAMDDHSSAVKELEIWFDITDRLGSDSYVNMKNNSLYAMIAESYAYIREYRKAEKYADLMPDSSRKKTTLRKINELMRKENDLILSSDSEVYDPASRKALDDAYALYHDVYGTENFELSDEKVVSKIRWFRKNDLYALLTWLTAASRIAVAGNYNDASVNDPDVTVSEAVQSIEKAFSYAFDNPLSESECIYNSGYIIGAFEASHRLIPVCHDGLLISSVLRTMFNAEQDDYYLDDLICAAEVTEFGRKYDVLTNLLNTLRIFYDNTQISLGRCIETDEQGNVDVRLNLKNRSLIKQWYNGVSDNVKNQLEGLIQSAHSEEDESGFNWGIYSIGYTAKEILDRLNGCYDEKGRKYFFIRFLENEEVLLDDDFLPEICGTFCGIEKMNILSRIERHVDTERFTLNERLKQLFSEPKEKHNFRSVRLIKKYASDIKDKKLENSPEFGHYTECMFHDKKCFMTCLSDFELDLDLYESWGTLSAENGDKKKILDLVRVWFRITTLTSDFGFFRTLLSCIREQIEINAEDHGNELMSALVGLTVSQDHSVGEDSKNRIASYIEQKNFKSAEFLLDCIRRKDTVAVEDHSAEPFSYFSEFVSEHAKNYRLVFGTEKSMGEIIKLNSGKQNLEDALVYCSNNQTEDSVRSAGLIRNWIWSDGKEGETISAIEKLMSLIGFDVSEVIADPEAADDKHFMVYCRDSEKTVSHPVPAFGSKTVTDGFRVLCLYGRNKTSDLIQSFKENSEQKPIPTLVLLDYTLNMEVRRELAMAIKQEDKLNNVFLVADRVVLLHLARHYSEDTILKRFLAVTVPFSNYQPYENVSGKKLPPELMTESELMKVQGNGDITAAGEKLRAEAIRILTAPLAYTGIHLSEEILTMILSETECDPVRVRMGGKSLVSVLGNKDYAGYEETDTPYYEVSNVHYLKALSVLKEMTENFAEEPEEEEIAEEPVETENVEESIESEAAEESEETENVEEVMEFEMTEESEETENVEEAIESEATEESEGTEYVEETIESETAEESEGTEYVEEAIESETAEVSEETEIIEESDESETIEFSEETEIAEEEIEFSSEEITDSETDFPEDIMAVAEVGDF